MIYPTNLRGGMYKKYHQDATVAKQRPSKQIRKGVNLAGILPLAKEEGERQGWLLNSIPHYLQGPWKTLPTGVIPTP